MKKAKYAFLILMLAAAVMLSGCQLALEEKEFSQDKLVGISVRLSDSATRFNNHKEYVDRRQPHEPDGAMVWLKTGYDEDGAVMSGAEYDDNGWFEPVHLSVNVSDEGEEHTIETAMYLAKDMLPENPLLEMEHVYQREDGTLYAIDNGSTYSGELNGLGLMVSQSHTVTNPDGTKKQHTTKIKVNVWYEEVVLSAEAVEMKGTGEEIARHQLTGQEELWVSPETEWILVEETLDDGRTRRTAVNAPLDKETFYVRKANESGVCIRETYTVRTSGALSEETKRG